MQNYNIFFVLDAQMFLKIYIIFLRNCIAYKTIVLIEKFFLMLIHYLNISKNYCFKEKPQLTLQTKSNRSLLFRYSDNKINHQEMQQTSGNQYKKTKDRRSNDLRP